MIRKLMKFVFGTVTVVLVMGLGFFLFMYFSPRPPLTIDPATLAGDGSAVNYCALPALAPIIHE